MNDEISGSSIERFIEDYEERKLERYYKSEMLPPTNEGHVKVCTIQLQS